MAKHKKSPRSGRRKGNPPGKRLIGPLELDQIARMQLQHVSIDQMAVKLGVSPSTIRHHLDTSVKPIWHYGIERLAEEELARIDMIERIAWERLESAENDQTETVKDVLAKETVDGQVVEYLKTVERATTRGNRSGGILGWMGVIQWAVQERCKIKGHYAAQRLQINQGGDIRVAGKTREDIDQELTERIAFVLESSARRKALADAYDGRSRN